MSQICVINNDHDDVSSRVNNNVTVTEPAETFYKKILLTSDQVIRLCSFNKKAIYTLPVMSLVRLLVTIMTSSAMSAISLIHR